MSAITLQEKTSRRRLIDRVWARFLSGAETKALQFVFTMTSEWGKAADRLKYSHFVDGVGKVCGTGLSERTVRRALKSLAERGILLVKRTLHGVIYAINFDWTSDMLATPKREKSAAAAALSTPKAERQSGQNGQFKAAKLTGSIPIEEHTEQDHTKHSSAPASEGPSRATPLSALRAAEDLVRNKFKLRRDAAKKAGKTNASSIQGYWAAGHREAFPDVAVPMLTREDQGKASLFLRTDTPQKAIEVFQWSVANWRLIMETRFAWMTRQAPPTYPAIGFMLKFKDRFYDAWNERERLRQDLALTGDERQMRRLMHRGLTKEEAQAEVAARSKSVAAQEKAAETVRELNKMFRKSEAEKEQAPQMVQPRRAKPAGPGPVRPGSSSSGRDIDDGF